MRFAVDGRMERVVQGGGKRRGEVRGGEVGEGREGRDGGRWRVECG